MISLICKVEKDNYLPPTLAASIVGKFGFLCSTLFGKVGRCCTASIRARQYSNSSDYTLNDPIKVSLALMKIFVQHCEPRRATVKHPEPPIIIYTDASDVPQRASDRYVLGAVLIDPSDATLEYTYWSVPQAIVDKWAFRETYMSQLEVLAGPLAYGHVGPRNCTKNKSFISLTTALQPVRLLRVIHPPLTTRH